MWFKKQIEIFVPQINIQPADLKQKICCSGIDTCYVIVYILNDLSRRNSLKKN